MITLKIQKWVRRVGGTVNLKIGKSIVVKIILIIFVILLLNYMGIEHLQMINQLLQDWQRLMTSNV